MGATALMSASSLSSAYSQSQAAEAQGEYQKQQADTNARLANAQAEDAIKRGETEAANQKKRTKQIIGAQRAAMAAGGTDINDGSNLEIQTQTAEIGAQDAATIKNNAWREAWGYKSQAINYSGQGKFAQMAGKNASQNTLLAGGMQAAAYGAKGYQDKYGPKK